MEKVLQIPIPLRNVHPQANPFRNSPSPVVTMKGLRKGFISPSCPDCSASLCLSLSVSDLLLQRLDGPLAKLLHDLLDPRQVGTAQDKVAPGGAHVIAHLAVFAVGIVPLGLHRYPVLPGV